MRVLYSSRLITVSEGRAVHVPRLSYRPDVLAAFTRLCSALTTYTGFHGDFYAPLVRINSTGFSVRRKACSSFSSSGSSTDGQRAPGR
jgi:hypothetical protein